MSTIKNIEITENGTLADFFAKIKEKILENTNFELASEDAENFILIFDTKISDLKLKITDSRITSNSSASSNQIDCLLFSDKLNITESSNCHINVMYCSTSCTKDTCTTRLLTLLNYEASNFSMSSILNCNTSSWQVKFNTFGLGKLNTKKIDDGSTVERVFFANRTFDLNGNYSELYLGNVFSSISSSGICYVNQMLSTGSTTGTISGKVTEYCENLYNCTNVTSGYKYNINGKTFFAIDSNILVEE